MTYKFEKQIENCVIILLRIDDISQQLYCVPKYENYSILQGKSDFINDAATNQIININKQSLTPS